MAFLGRCQFPLTTSQCSQLKIVSPPSPWPLTASVPSHNTHCPKFFMHDLHVWRTEALQKPVQQQRIKLAMRPHTILVLIFHASLATSYTNTFLPPPSPLPFSGQKKTYIWTESWGQMRDPRALHSPPPSHPLPLSIQLHSLFTTTAFITVNRKTEFNINLFHTQMYVHCNTVCTFHAENNE